MTIEAVTTRNHKWGDPLSILRTETSTGCDETHRTCALCNVVKITVHPPQGYPYRVWMHASGQRFQMDRRPPCLDAAETSPASAQDDSTASRLPDNLLVDPPNTRNPQQGDSSR